MKVFIKCVFSSPFVLGLVVLVGFLAGCDQGEPGKVVVEEDLRPNFLILVADDLGYTDIGSYGGEIRTPNLDVLAKNSVRFTNFHVLPMCAPTRAVLLSGVDNHIAGLGSMFDSGMLEGVSGQVGYERYLHERVATLPELLRDDGYQTLMAGKWHLGASEGMWPIDRGFEQSFALLAGAGDHFSFLEDGYAENDMIAEFDAEGFYSTRTYTDKLIEFVNKNHSDGRPFFAYAAYTAPHWPLQVPDDYLDRYKGEYDEGFDVLRDHRIERARSLGSIPDLDYSESIEATGPAWADLDPGDKQHYARRMEIYSAMVENLDHHIGRLINHLESIEELENTVILFMSDNGAESDEMERNPIFAERVRRGNYN
ncbi:MAG: sulfatase-like hydrolase/transferase, partial [Pseudomonadota bacterium]|nr:sulfatase-like hydrolase/transferase [Pseudomonadota bacterium]